MQPRGRGGGGRLAEEGAHRGGGGGALGGGGGALRRGRSRSRKDPGDRVVPAPHVLGAG